MELISVIIPTFNRRHYLEKAVTSVLKQQGDHLGEIIIIDDGSTDDTQHYVTSCLPKQLCKYIKTEHNGVARARNIGVKKARYPLIAFLDSDDHWQQNKLVQQYSAMQRNPQFVICHTGERWYRRGKHLNQKAIHKPQNGYIFDHCLKLCAVGMSTVVMKKKVFENLGGFDETMVCCEDYDLWLRISWRYEFLLVDEPLTIKEGGRPDQLSAIHRQGMDNFRIYALNKLLSNESLNEAQKRSAVEELVAKCTIYGNGCIKHGRPDEGNKVLKMAKQWKNRMENS